MGLDSGDQKRIKDSLCEIFLTDGMIRVQVLPGSLEEDDVKRIVERVQQFAGHDTYPVLVLPDKNTRISFFAVRVLASEAAMNYAEATAYIIRSFHHQLMAEALFRMYFPSKPIRVFTDEQVALTWLGNFKKD